MALERDFITPDALVVQTTANVVGNTVSVDMFSNGLRAQSLPSFNANFARSPYLDPRFTVSRTTTATYASANGLILTAAANVPRFEYDPVTGECKGLLVEEQRTNIVPYGADIGNPNGWGVYDGANPSDNNNAAVIQNAGTSPDGQANATFFYHKTPVSTYYVLYNGFGSIVNGTAYTHSIFVKANTSPQEPQFAMGQYDGVDLVNAIYFTYDFTSNTIGNITQSSNCALQTGPCIQDYPDGWKRLYYTFRYTNGTVGASRSYVQFKHELNSSALSTSTSNVRGVYVWGCQIENAPNISSVIPTYTNSAVTKAGDYVFANNITSFFNGNTMPAITVVARTSCMAYNANSTNIVYPAVWSLETTPSIPIDGTYNRTSVYYAPSGNAISQSSYWRANTAAFGGQQWGMASIPTSISANQVISNAQYTTTALVCQTNNWIFYSNGSQLFNNTANQGFFSANTNRMSLGGGDSPLHGYVKTIALYPRALSNTEMYNITQI